MTGHRGLQGRLRGNRDCAVTSQRVPILSSMWPWPKIYRATGSVVSSVAARLILPVSASSPLDQPIVRDRHCKKCGHPLVRFLLTTGYVIYLHCELCGHEWNEPERRKAPRYKH